MHFSSILTAALLLSVSEARVIGNNEKFAALTEGFPPADHIAHSFKECKWFGTAPFCDPECPDGWHDVLGHKCGPPGDKCCATGHKLYCCNGFIVEAEVEHAQTVPDPIVELQMRRCEWFGKAPLCNGECPDGWSKDYTDECGDGACCVTGKKVYCCTSENSAFVNAQPELDVSITVSHHHSEGCKGHVEEQKKKHISVEEPTFDHTQLQEVVHSNGDISIRECGWFGTAPVCRGECPPGWRTDETSRCGDGSCCINGKRSGAAALDSSSSKVIDKT